MMPTTLHTARCVLQPIAPADADALHAHWTRPEVRKYLWDDAVIDAAQVPEIIAESARLFAAHGYGLWRVATQNDATLVGCAGYWFFHEPSQLELIISLDGTHWGQGFATEVGQALIRYAFEALNFDAVLASNDTANEASQQLVDRLGFQFLRRAEADGLDTLFYEIRRQAAT